MRLPAPRSRWTARRGVRAKRVDQHSAPVAPRPIRRRPGRGSRRLLPLLAAASAWGCTPPPGAGGSTAPAPSTPAPAATEAPAAPPASAAAAAPAGPPEGWPETLFVWTEAERERVLLGPAPDALAFAALRAGTPIAPAGGVEGERLAVRVPGDLEVYGWLPTDRLGARARRTCRVGGTPAYLGPNDEVQVLGPDPRGLTRVRVRPALGREGVAPLGPYEGVCPPSYFGAAVVDPEAAGGPSPGTPMRLPAGQQVPLHDRPGGEVVASLPALTPPLTVVVLRDQGGWKGVRVGVGPYLVGFVDVTLTPADAAPPASEPRRLPPPEGGAEAPADLRAQGGAATLRQVLPDTDVHFDDMLVARVKSRAWASEQRRYDGGGVDVVIANDRVMVRGLVNAANLEAPATGTAP